VTISFGAAAEGWSWLDIIKTTLPPFIALIGAIGIYFAQRKSDREQVLREKRSVIYADYLSLLVNRKFIGGSIPAQDFFEYVQQLSNFHSLIVVIAPKEVVQASKKVFFEAMQRGMERANAKSPELNIDADRSVHENFVENREKILEINGANRAYVKAYQELIKAMRSDLLSGTNANNLPNDDVFGNEA
jgi:xanthosine utilization system XapX-like protein